MPYRARPSACTAYHLDERDVIVGVSGGWNAFADANGGEGARREAVLGEELWRFISGEETISHLNAMLFWSRRRHAAFTLDHRCDGPGVRRVSRMRVAPLKPGRLRVEHRLISERPFSPGEIAMAREAASEAAARVAERDAPGFAEARGARISAAGVRAEAMARQSLPAEADPCGASCPVCCRTRFGRLWVDTWALPSGEAFGGGAMVCADCRLAALQAFERSEPARIGEPVRLFTSDREARSRPVAPAAD